MFIFQSLTGIYYLYRDQRVLPIVFIHIYQLMKKKYTLHVITNRFHASIRI